MTTTYYHGQMTERNSITCLKRLQRTRGQNITWLNEASVQVDFGNRAILLKKVASNQTSHKLAVTLALAGKCQLGF